jgi:two-component system, NarL family, sensor kinase
VNYVRAAKFSEKTKDLTSHASSLNQIGLVYLELKNYSFALTYFERARVLYTSASFFRGAADAGLNMAEIHLELGNTGDAERTNLKSMESRRLFGDTSEMGYNYYLFSRLNTKRGLVEQALSYSRIATNLFRKNEDDFGLSPSYIQQGFCFEKLNQVDSALYYYKESFRYAKKYQYKKYIAEAANSLAKTFEKLNRSDSAIVYLKLYTVYNDSLLNETIADATADAAARYETEKKDIELNNTKQLSKQMSQQLYILTGLVIVLVLSILLIVRNFGQRKKIQEKESALNNANAMIEGQDLERERIARELHDRVGSMLSTVKLQVSTMDDQMGTLIQQHGESYKKVIRLLDDTYDEVRRISHDLDSGLLSRFGFKTAMLQLVQLLESTNK